MHSTHHTSLPALGLALLLSLSTAAASLAQDPGKLYASALALAEQGDFEGAARTLEPLRNTSPLPPAALALLGALEVRLGRTEQALATLRPLVDAPEAGAMALYNAGRAARQLGRFEEAERYLRRAGDGATPEEPAFEAQRDLGLMLGGLGRLAQALPVLLAWVASHPADTEARLAAAACAVELNRPPEARRLLEDMAGDGGLADDDPRVTLLRGKLLLITGQPQAAADLLAAQLHSARPRPIPDRLALDLRRVAAEAYLRLANGQAAVDLLHGRSANDASLTLLLARAHYSTGEAERAARTLEPWRATMEESTSTSGLAQELRAAWFYQFGRALLAQNLAEQALPYLEKATALAPSDTPSWQGYGQALVLSGQRSAGRAALERFRQLTLQSASRSQRQASAEAGASDPTRRNLAQAAEWAERGETDRAFDLLHQEQAVAPQDPRPWLAEIRLLDQLGQLPRARQLAEEAAKRFPDRIEEFRSAVRPD